MMAANAKGSTAPLAEREIVLTRQVDAEAAAIWRAWTEPALVKRWFGPDCFEVTGTAMDLRPGGRWTLSFRGRDGSQFDGQVFDHGYTFREIVPGRRLMMTEAWPDMEFLVTCEVAPKDDGALVTFRALFASAAERQAAAERGMLAGANASLDKLKAVAESRPNERDIRFTRLLLGTPAAAFAAWTEPEQIKQWWGPHGMRTPECELDLRPGGQFRALMRDSEGREYPMTAVVKAVEPGRSITVALPMGAGEASATTSFTAEGEGKVRVTTHWRHATAADRAQHEAMGFEVGWDQMFKRLQAHLIGPGARRDLVLTRRYKAPRALVWKAWTDPAHLARWWGPEGFTNPTCRFDARPGGAIYIVMRAPDGSDYPMSGRVLEIEAPTRLVFLARAEGEQQELLLESLAKVTFTEAGEETEVRVEAHGVGLVPLSVGMLQGMEQGWSGSLEKLARVLAA